MAAVGFSLSKIALEKKEGPIPKLEIKTKIALKSITKDVLKLGQGKDVLKIAFQFGIEYAPQLATFNLEGALLYLVDSSESEKIIKEFKKTGKLEGDIQLKVYNIIFQKCNIKALQLCPELGLPAHIRLPAISVNNQAEKK